MRILQWKPRRHSMNWRKISQYITILLFLGAFFSLGGAARADKLNIPGTAFYFIEGTDGLPPSAGYGSFETDYDATIFLPLSFPPTHKSEENVVCKFSMVYVDNSTTNITARLVAKRLRVGVNPSLTPTVLATVASTGSGTLTRMASTTFNPPVPLDTESTAYYVRVRYPGTGAAIGSLQVVGIQIHYGPTLYCS